MRYCGRRNRHRLSPYETDRQIHSVIIHHFDIESECEGADHK